MKNKDEDEYDRLMLRWKCSQDIFSASLQKYGAIIFIGEPTCREKARQEVMMQLETSLDLQEAVAYQSLTLSGIDPSNRHIL